MSRSPMLFLSHAGSDTEAARRLRNALLQTEVAREAGLEVWFDKDHMLPGSPWQPQVEQAIERASAFAVYVGATGVINWVAAEVHVAQLRAIGGKPPLPFIPVLNRRAGGVETLPGFTRQFQALEDVEANGYNNEAFRQLLAVAVEAKGEPGTLVLESEPFFGLAPILEERSHLFFGRGAEIEELATRLGTERLLLIAGDSGSGKSSLVHAGLLSAWRGGVIAERAGRRTNEELWHTISFRPRANPRRELHQATYHSALRLGRSPIEAAELAQLTKSDDPDTVRVGLLCGLEPGITRTLVFIDQFEELVIQTPEQEREDIVTLLLELADLEDPAFTVVMTMRSDYTYLLHGPETRALHEALGARANARYTLRAVTAEGLEEIVRGPLGLTGRESAEIEAVVAQVSQDVGERPGDLALVQFALTRMWESRHHHNDDLVEAYVGVGGVRGALAQEAERVYREVLGGDENEERIAAALIRLGRLGDVGGLTRRVALKEEFSEAGWKVMQRLASPDGNRLVLLGRNEDERERAEIAHEALLTQWERLHSWFDRDPERMRVLYRLTERASEWRRHRTEGAASEAEFATSSSLATFSDLRQSHPDWLSSIESEFVISSENEHKRVLIEQEYRIEREQTLREHAERSSKRFKRATKVAWSLTAFAVILAIGLGTQWSKANDRFRIEQELNDAELQTKNSSRMLAESRANEAFVMRQLAEARAERIEGTLAEVQKENIELRSQLLVQTSEPRTIVAGVRSDAAPFSYESLRRKNAAILPGYSGYMIEICRRVLDEMVNIGPFSGYKTKLKKVSAEGGWKDLEEGNVDLLCGPSSITFARLVNYNVSNPLFISGAIYVKASEFPKSSYCNGVIGLLETTATQSDALLGLLANVDHVGKFVQPILAYLVAINSSDAGDSGVVEGNATSLRQSVSSERHRPVSSSIITQECENGYTEGPVLYFESHDDGIDAFCTGKILFYVGDLDILDRKIGCPYEAPRVTLTRELYGVFFRRAKESSTSIVFDSALYGEFSNILRRKVIVESVLEYEFKAEFGDTEPSRDLAQFFESTRVGF